MPFLVLGISWVSKTRESNYLHRDAHGSAVTLAMDIIAQKKPTTEGRQGKKDIQLSASSANRGTEITDGAL